MVNVNLPKFNFNVIPFVEMQALFLHFNVISLVEMQALFKFAGKLASETHNK